MGHARHGGATSRDPVSSPLGLWQIQGRSVGLSWLAFPVTKGTAMVEIHDASAADGGPYALFGFIGIPPDAREDQATLKSHVEAQLIRLFGDKAAAPSALFIKDWAFDPLTATEADKAPLYAHPQYGMPSALAGLWDDKLLFAGTEVASQFGGYLEGALEAAGNTLRKLDADHG